MTDIRAPRTSEVRVESYDLPTPRGAIELGLQLPRVGAFTCVDGESLQGDASDPSPLTGFTPLSISYGAAQPWSTLNSAVLGRTCFSRYVSPGALRVRR